MPVCPGARLLSSPTATDTRLDDLDYDYAASVAARALRCMADQQIPATPNNFNVWFHYFLGAPDDLRHAIDILVDNHRPFDARTNQDLLATYIEPHGVGDQVLRLMAKVLREKVRDIDLPARYGGEELIAVLPDSDLATSAAVAERIRRSIAECRITRRSTGEVLPAITVSIGVAQFRPGESVADLIERCDRALYLAKSGGRNRVVAENERDRALAAG